MDDLKYWYHSTTIWGALISAAGASRLHTMGFDISADREYRGSHRRPAGSPWQADGDLGDPAGLSLREFQAFGSKWQLSGRRGLCR
ncbi:hypothetical protein [Rhizobium sullae]